MIEMPEATSLAWQFTVDGVPDVPMYWRSVIHPLSGLDVAPCRKPADWMSCIPLSSALCPGAWPISSVAIPVGGLSWLSAPLWHAPSETAPAQARVMAAASVHDEYRLRMESPVRQLQLSCCADQPDAVHE